MRTHIEVGEFKNHLAEEHDSCGIIAIVEKNGQPSHQNVLRTIDALIKMEHRSGFINGEGDGCGILVDIPRSLWAHRLASTMLSADSAFDPRFAVAHIFIPKKGHDVQQVMSDIRSRFADYGFEILLERENAVNSSVLGKNGKADEPIFWQIAGLCHAESGKTIDSHLFELHVEIEKTHHVHVASLSSRTASYKVMGAANILPKYFEDVSNPEFASVVTLGHNRYSTNTLSNFFRVQPFSLLGHNGEINTIRKLEAEAEMIGVPLVEGGSDSQNMDRTIETLIHRYGMSLFEAMEMVFPPIINEMKNLRPELQDLYVYYRQTWGHFAQGPAAVVSRFNDECVFSVDALGLRPLWMIDNETSYFFSSEQGIIPVSEMIMEPKSLAPGEKVAIHLHPEKGAEVLYHHQLQEKVLERAGQRADFLMFREQLKFTQLEKAKAPFVSFTEVSNQAFAAFGWERELILLAEQMADNGAEPIRSLGHDAPLAILADARQNIADYIKESVAVVTNPAIDREREMEHFSTRVVLGGRPRLYDKVTGQPAIELPSPLLLEGELLQELAAKLNTASLEQILEHYNQQENIVAVLSTHFNNGETMPQALERIAAEAIIAVQGGSRILLLDDGITHQDNCFWIDPHLVVSKVDKALKMTFSAENRNLRRQASIILRSGAIRSLHDVAVAAGLGADAIDPYLLFATVYGKDGVASVENLYKALSKGLEKVVSTIGIHELRGYARLFSSIGLRQNVAEVLDIVNFCGSEQAGTSWEDLEEDSRLRHEEYQNDDKNVQPARLFRAWPRIWKVLGDVAAGRQPYSVLAEKMDELELENPTSIRHATDIDFASTASRISIDPEQVDVGVGEHSLPFLISSMSFGSQNEIAFRSYAEAADQLNMISLNGEGGEIKDMLGKYPKTRGQQIASGRFGVNVELLNSSNLLEIKIGQGAKPGEGGHLPASKVTEKVAAARNATTGTDLISPSNNHDIYSIEDLAQVITELKTANHQAKVAVKVPVVPNIGTIAVGIAKAGADIITLSGFDGGTGAARIHALQHVGLPVEIGVKAAHTALIEAGLRHKVELWADGGIKSAKDVIKMMLLGANRIGFGTISMMAIGCTACRGCHLDTCHVGIATQIESVEEAKEKGLRRFVPREMESSVRGLITYYTELGKEIARLTALLGFTRTQDLVGRSDLLKQTRYFGKLDLTAMLQPALIELEQEKQTANVLSEVKLLVAAGSGDIVGTESNNDFYASHNSPVNRHFTGVLSDERVLGSRYSGERVKQYLDGSYKEHPPVSLFFDNGSVPGNGLAAYNAEGVNIRVSGGAQDGVGKTSFGGKISVLKASGLQGEYIDGSVGKCFGYGAQKGLFIVQGNADARAGIRLSGADIIIGGEMTSPLQDHLGNIGSRANIKGFAFEYMTNGRALVMGDPGPWICSGMTGGVVYLRLRPELGLDKEALQRRVAKAAKVSLQPLNDKGKKDVSELLTSYAGELLATGQAQKAEEVQSLIPEADRYFLMAIPIKEQADPSVSTE